MQLPIISDPQGNPRTIWRLEDENEDESHLRELELKVQEDLEELLANEIPKAADILKEKWKKGGSTDDDIRTMIEYLETLVLTPE